MEVELGFKNPLTIKNVFTNLKDKDSAQLTQLTINSLFTKLKNRDFTSCKSNVIYCIPCADSESKYIGQTS